MRFVPRSEILTFEEIERVIRLLASMGVNKVRITGGEPFVRSDVMEILRRIRAIDGIKHIHLTTNGVLTSRYIPELKELGIAGINLSLDTLDPRRFRQLTRRNNLSQVLETFHKALEYDIPLKLNMVVIENFNTGDIIPMSRLAEQYPVDVRFIEEMPFNGTNNGNGKLKWNSGRILSELRGVYPNLSKVEDGPYSTSVNYLIPAFRGKLGIIAGFSRTFCGTCNRIRLTAKGMIKTCLYDEGVFNLKDFLRTGATDSQIREMIRQVIGNRSRDGFEVQKKRKSLPTVSESMSAIGG